MVRMRAELKGVVVAESSQTVVVGGRHYFPPEDVVSRHLRPVGIRTSLRGRAALFDVCLDTTRASEAAWCLARPWWPRRVRGRVAFTAPVIVRRIDEP